MEENTELEIALPMKTQDIEQEKILSNNLFESETEPETKATIDGWWLVEGNGMSNFACCEMEAQAVEMFRILNRVPNTEIVTAVPASRLPMGGEDALYIRLHEAVQVGESLVVPNPVVVRCAVDSIPVWCERRNQSGLQS